MSLPSDIVRRYPRYGLYAYSEGHTTGQLRLMKFTGIPVLFIPGNLGSYKQGKHKPLSNHLYSMNVDNLPVRPNLFFSTFTGISESSEDIQLSYTFPF